jgi:hypothetical protein
VPRQIIDTESSRPAYVRRQVTTFVAIVLVAAILAFAGWWYWGHHGLAPAPVTTALPGNAVR